jgi:hypothetical protein
MIVGTGKIYLYANWVHSLKEKRMIVKSTIAKVKNKALFKNNVEIERQHLKAVFIASYKNIVHYLNPYYPW